MSVAICSWSSTSVPFPLEKKEALGSLLNVSVPATMVKNDQSREEAERPPGRFDIWTSIQARKAEQSKLVADEPYVHPLTKRSSSLMTQESLEVCTESLGSETGSEELVDAADYSVTTSSSARRRPPTKRAADEYAGVNYHCSLGRRSPGRSFPPPLPSISCRDGPCVQMRPRREDGRLVVEAVAVHSQNYLHAERRGGRLLLSFVDNATPPRRNADTDPQVADELEDVTELEDQEEEEEEEEEVEVVDRGTVVEVKVSTQSQKHGGGGSAATKAQRSTSIVINKFVSCTADRSDGCGTTTSLRRSTAGATTAAAAAVAASSLSACPAAADGGLRACSTDNKLLFTTRRRNREELLTDMKRCSQLRKPLFIWETCCIATSS
ncbi:putative protein FAF-like, chloroplastic [Iris pallida]|uniref:FAF domain-containing protein n=1 Tax=Iris pallida TaxID=29817 RepID=A0AAX6I6N4_IRIPA|nr:putative protein FAF-like, chloroplastic [Iris pallida]